MTFVASGTLDMGANIQYLSTLFHGEELHHFDSLSPGVEVRETLTVDYIFRSLALYFPPVNFLLKKKSLDAPWNEETAKSKSKTICSVLG